LVKEYADFVRETGGFVLENAGFVQGISILQCQNGDLHPENAAFGEETERGHSCPQRLPDASRCRLSTRVFTSNAAADRNVRAPAAIFLSFGRNAAILLAPEARHSGEQR
jgi:hypothetical protein